MNETPPIEAAKPTGSRDAYEVLSDLIHRQKELNRTLKYYEAAYEKHASARADALAVFEVNDWPEAVLVGQDRIRLTPDGCLKVELEYDIPRAFSLKSPFETSTVPAVAEAVTAP